MSSCLPWYDPVLKSFLPQPDTKHVPLTNLELGKQMLLMVGVIPNGTAADNRSMAILLRRFCALNEG